ncbi:MAG: hypothetical protein NWE95_06410 [Candidatus Bathyarchaeota archaeon]|jgi:hypothetical protein|nr:hypothetical protein [Candidatus Bathyarchaeota archaeon]
MNKKTIYIIVAVLVVVIVVAGAAILLMNGGFGGEPTATPTPTPTSVVGATTLQFTVEETTNGAVVIYDYAVKNVNASNEIIRVDIPAGNASYIINLGESKSFVSMDNGATWSASDFATDSNFAVIFNDYLTNLVNWNGHDATYSFTAQGGASVVISAIHVNPPLEDSMFATS